MVKVHIVGAGPAGLMTACLLSERGHEIVLYEKTGRTGGCWHDPDDEGREHSPRVLLDWYHTFRDVQRLVGGAWETETLQLNILRHMTLTLFDVLYIAMRLPFVESVQDLVEDPVSEGARRFFNMVVALFEESPERTRVSTLIHLMAVSWVGVQVSTIPFTQMLRAEQYLADRNVVVRLNTVASFDGSALEVAGTTIVPSTEERVVLCTNGQHSAFTGEKTTTSGNIQFHFRDPVDTWFDDQDLGQMFTQDWGRVAMRMRAWSDKTISVAVIKMRHLDFEADVWRAFSQNFRERTGRDPPAYERATMQRPFQPWSLSWDTAEQPAPYVHVGGFARSDVPAPINTLEGAAQAAVRVAEEVHGGAVAVGVTHRPFRHAWVVVVVALVVCWARRRVVVQEGGAPIIVHDGDERYDLTAFAKEHPGGAVIWEANGKQLSEAWESVPWHEQSDRVKKVLKKYRVS